MTFLIASALFWLAVACDLVTSERAEVLPGARERAWVYRDRDGRHSVRRHVAWAAGVWCLALAAHWLEPRSAAFVAIWIGLLGLFGGSAAVGAVHNWRQRQ